MRYRVLSALGNTFVVVREQPGAPLGADGARALCEEARTNGLIALRDDPLADSYSGSARLCARVWNKDGSDGGFSGNGLRCAAVSVVIDRMRTDEVDIPIPDLRRSGVGVMLHTPLQTCRMCVWADDEAIRSRGERGTWSSHIHIGAAVFDPEAMFIDQPCVDSWTHPNRTVGITVGGVMGCGVWVGNPHFVVFVEDELSEAAAVKTAEWVRISGAFRMGVNVELCRVIENGGGDRAGAMEMIPVERGVGVTAACGSGAAAAVGAAHELGYVGKDCVVRMLGGDAEISVVGESLVLRSGVEVLGEGEAPGIGQ